MTAQPTNMQTQAEKALLEILGGQPLTGAREIAAGRLRESGLPHRRVEEWKYTDLRAYLKDFPTLADQSGAVLTREPLVPADVSLQVVNGHAQSVPGELPDGVSISVAKTDNGTAFHTKPSTTVDLNTALSNGGYSIAISKADKVPVIFIDHIVDGTEAVTAAFRHSITVESGANATLVERFSGPSDVAYLVSGGLSAFVGDGAFLTHTRVVNEGPQSSHLGAIGARLGANATYEPFVMTLGSYLVRTDVHLTFEGEHSHGGVRGATLIKGDEHTDMTLEVDHAAPNCTSIEQFKSVIDGRAQAVFQGKIMVKQIAQKTDAKMMSQGLLLSENGEFLNKPELEIFADDVVCGHGATCGDLDDNLLFYLLSRGIPRPVAETMMVQAFVSEAIEDTEQPEIIEALEAMVEDWLATRQA
ncbi:MAG: Fe-S cluster assembly protein SufD [Hyphomicrobiales bacterium]